MNVKPLGDKILVQRVEAQEQTDSGLFLPEDVREKPQEAKVIAVGEGKRNDVGELIPLGVKEGDTVILGKWGGSELVFEGKTYLIMSIDEVLARVEGR